MWNLLLSHQYRDLGNSKYIKFIFQTSFQISSYALKSGIKIFLKQIKKLISFTQA